MIQNALLVQKEIFIYNWIQKLGYWFFCVLIHDKFEEKNSNWWKSADILFDVLVLFCPDSR